MGAFAADSSAEVAPIVRRSAGVALADIGVCGRLNLALAPRFWTGFRSVVVANDGEAALRARWLFRAGVHGSLLKHRSDALPHRHYTAAPGCCKKVPTSYQTPNQHIIKKWVP